LREGYGEAHLPYALARKYPRAGYEWSWQYVFPSKSRSVHPEGGVRSPLDAHASEPQDRAEQPLVRYGVPHLPSPRPA
jgi:hypothetical protein